MRVLCVDWFFLRVIFSLCGIMCIASLFSAPSLLLLQRTTRPVLASPPHKCCPPRRMSRVSCLTRRAGRGSMTSMAQSQGQETMRLVFFPPSVVGLACARQPCSLLGLPLFLSLSRVFACAIEVCLSRNTAAVRLTPFLLLLCLPVQVAASTLSPAGVAPIPTEVRDMFKPPSKLIVVPPPDAYACPNMSPVRTFAKSPQYSIGASKRSCVCPFPLHRAAFLPVCPPC